MELQGKVALITGASRGIGRAVAEAYAAAGASLAICARGAGELEEAAAALRRSGAGVGAAPTDVSDAAQVDWTAVLAMNLTGPFLCARAVVPAMRRQGGASSTSHPGSGATPWRTGAPTGPPSGGWRG